MLGAYVDIENTTLEKGAVITTEKVTHGASYENAAAALEGVSENYVVYEINGTYNGESVQPDGAIKTTFAIPVEFSGDFAVYCVAADGALEEIEYEINAALGVIVTQLTQLGTVAFADAPARDVPETTSPETDVESSPETETETKVPKQLLRKKSPRVLRRVTI